MHKKTYLKLLQDPKWQKKRLETFQARGWKCEQCQDTETSLHIHHKVYHRGFKPWDYADDELEVLCENCHSLSYQIKKAIESIYPCLSMSSQQKLLGYSICLLSDKDKQEYPCDPVWNQDVIEGAADYMCATYGDDRGYAISQIRKRVMKTETDE